MALEENDAIAALFIQEIKCRVRMIMRSIPLHEVQNVECTSSRAQEAVLSSLRILTVCTGPTVNYIFIIEIVH